MKSSWNSRQLRSSRRCDASSLPVQTSRLSDLPEDNLLCILQMLSPLDVVHLSETSCYFQQSAKKLRSYCRRFDFPISVVITDAYFISFNDQSHSLHLPKHERNQPVGFGAFSVHKSLSRVFRIFAPFSKREQFLRELLHLLKFLGQCHNLQSLTTNLPLFPLKQLFQAWAPPSRKFTYTNNIHHSKENDFLSILSRFEHLDLLLHVGVPTRFSFAFFLDPKIQQLKSFVARESTGLAGALDDELLLRIFIPFLHLETKGTSVSPDGINRFIHQWIEGKREIVYLHLGFRNYYSRIEATILGGIKDARLDTETDVWSTFRNSDGAVLYMSFDKREKTLVLYT